MDPSPPSPQSFGDPEILGEGSVLLTKKAFDKFGADFICKVNGCLSKIYVLEENGTKTLVYDPSSTSSLPSYCDKTLECCRDLHDNVKLFGGTQSKGKNRYSVRCVLQFGGLCCRADVPTIDSLRLYDLLKDERELVEKMKEKIHVWKTMCDEPF